MRRIAHFDLASGASGDMIIAALAAAGTSLDVDVHTTVVDAVSSLDLGCSVTFLDDERGGLACLRAEVKTDGQTHSAGKLREAIERAEIAASARERAERGLDELVRAEAAVHGADPDEVHLHELASADTAADLVGSAAALHALGIDRVSAAAVPVPSGWIESGHGPLPLPAPVTLELLRGATLRGVEDQTELVTPTAAAILVAHDTTFGSLPELVLQAAGTGGGTRDTERPNICRVLVGAEPHLDGVRTETAVLLETNIDDQTPESLGYAVESLVRGGALDAWVTPIVMKKTRPALLLSVLVRPDDETRIVEDVFRLTTTLGIRRRETSRWALERGEIHVRVWTHDVRVKIGKLGEEVVNVAPEFGDCVRVAEATGHGAHDVYREATAVARRALKLSSPTD